MPEPVVVVMPLHNEERHVASTLRGLPSVVSIVVVVDDGSTDRSVEVLGGLADPRVRVVRHDERRGVGRALATGFAEALRLGAGSIVTMDADGQMDPRDLPALLAPLRGEEALYVKGCRLDDARAMPLRLRAVNRGLSFAWSRILREPDLRDAHCGFTAAHRRVVERMDLDALHDSYGVYSDILAQVLSQPLARVAYVPVRAIYGDEVSHFRARDAVWLAALLVRLWWRGRRLRERVVQSVGPTPASAGRRAARGRG